MSFPWLSSLILLMSFYFIGKSADILIRALSNLGVRLRWSKFIIGFIILGLATSMPEMFLMINAGVEGVPELSLGNLLGGIVVLFSLLIGLNTLLQGTIQTQKKFSTINLSRLVSRLVPFRKQFLVKELFLMAGVILLPLILLIDQELSRLDGLILVLMYVLFIIHAVFDKRLESWQPPTEQISWPRMIIFLASGLIGLFFFSWLIVEHSLILAKYLNIPSIILGLILLAIGTNIPELTLTIKARNQHGELVVGDIFGSALANVLLVGILGLFFPFKIVLLKPVLIVSVSLLIITLSLVLFLHTKDRLERWEGGILIMLYLVYLYFEIIRF